MVLCSLDAQCGNNTSPLLPIELLYNCCGLIFWLHTALIRLGLLVHVIRTSSLGLSNGKMSFRFLFLYPHDRLNFEGQEFTNMTCSSRYFVHKLAFLSLTKSRSNTPQGFVYRRGSRFLHDITTPRKNIFYRLHCVLLVFKFWTSLLAF
jgi:hypothetical protein